MSTESTIQTRTNKQLEFNLGTFNIPTIVGLISIFLLVWNGSAERARLDAQVELRLTTIEKDRANARVAYESTVRDLTTTAAVVPQLQYRITATEQGLVAANSRLDRQSDAINGVRDSIADLGTKIEVLSQKLDMAMAGSDRRTDLLRELPPELKQSTIK